MAVQLRLATARRMILQIVDYDAALRIEPESAEPLYCEGDRSRDMSDPAQ
jgi:hypothetical protein